LIPWNDYKDDLRDEWNRQADAFGMDLGPFGLLVEGYAQRMYEIAAEVLQKAWPADIAQRFQLDGDPVMLIIDRDWVDFDPRSHPYAIVWLSEMQPADVRPLLQELARLSRTGADVIGHLQGMARRQSRATFFKKAWGGAGAGARLASYVEIKPSVFGVSIDVSAFLRDLADSSKKK
jgi:hypothetical protein